MSAGKRSVEARAVRMIRDATGSLLRGIVWVLVLSILLPPGIMAQTLEDLRRAQVGANAEDQIIVTDPTALQERVPTQVPCPSPVQPSRTQDDPGSLDELWPFETNTLLPSSIDQRMRQERERRIQLRPRETAQRAEDSSSKSSEPRLGGIRRDQDAPVVGDRRLARNYTIEESFAQFSVLQNLRGQLSQYGYDFFFDAQATGFAPVKDAPVGPDYVIGPADSLAVHVWNVPDPRLNRSYIVPVGRDGTLVIPRIGAIPVGGLTFSQAEQAITGRLRSHLKRFEVHIAMARLRTIKVFVVGEVVRPGAYELSSLATVSNALYAACGPAKSGSLREIKVVRDGNTLTILDLYEFLLDGDRTHDQRLQAGDVIVIPPIGQVAAISGAVKRSAIYELKPKSRLSDMLRLAGGITAVADRHRCHIYRIEPGKGRVLLDVDLGPLLPGSGGQQPNNKNDHPLHVDPIIKDGDYLRINALPTQVANVVSLAGAVKSPGPYQFRPGMKLGDILSPSQLTMDAYLDQAEIVRTDPVNYQTQVIQFNPMELFRGKEEANFRLQRLDQIVVQSQVRPPNLVFLNGEVKRPGYYTIEQGERLSSVLTRAGGFTDNAFPQGLVFIRESLRDQQQAQLQRFIASERQRLTAESAGIAAGAAAVAGGAPVTTSSPGAQQQVLALRLQQLETIASRVELGRVVVHVDSIEQLRDTEDDLRLKSGDSVTIPQPPQTVSIIGAVKNPSSFVHRTGLALEDYLYQAGGLTEDANEDQIYVVRANGSTDSAYLSLKHMESGDTVVVPQKVEEKTPKLALWQSVASIIGSVALAAAGIAVIGNN